MKICDRNIVIAIFIYMHCYEVSIKNSIHIDKLFPK